MNSMTLNHKDFFIYITIRMLVAPAMLPEKFEIQVLQRWNNKPS